MADQRLDEQPGDRPRNPEDREIVDRRAQRLEDAADIGVLEREPDLDAEKAERDVPQPPEPEPPLGLGHSPSLKLNCPAPPARTHDRRAASSRSVRGAARCKLRGHRCETATAPCRERESVYMSI